MRSVVLNNKQINFKSWNFLDGKLFDTTIKIKYSICSVASSYFYALFNIYKPHPRIMISFVEEWKW